ncbi:MAG: MarR family winged helix-turn-helix transcriptional regulator [Chloroflexota bacterium]|jgi:DNA-binding MarR family transcriptional regulator
MSNDSHLSDLLLALDYFPMDEDTPDDLLPFMGFLIAKAAQTIVETVDESMASFGISSRHYGVMLMLSRHDGLPQVAVGEKLRIDRTTMVKLVDDLEKQDLVERRRDPHDRRAYALSLSEKGREMLPEISRRAVEVERASLASLKQDEIRQLFRILLKLVKGTRTT